VKAPQLGSNLESFQKMAPQLVKDFGFKLESETQSGGGYEWAWCHHLATYVPGSSKSRIE